MEIQTFIFFDLETTGLIQEKIMPKITEIALIAVARKSLYNKNKNSLPRILHKLVLPVNPQKIIPSRVEYLTKLSNEDMQLVQPFDCEIYELLIYFMRRLTPPICFVAHNGNNFDYPIFLWELECISKIIDNGILCIDTWKMFQDFFRKEQSNITPYPSNSKMIENLLSDEYNESLSTMLDVVMTETKEVQDVTSVLQTLPCENSYTRVLANKHDANQKHININNQSPNCKQETNETTPKNQIIKLQNVFMERPSKKHNYNSRRKLNFNCGRPISLKLGDIYEHMFGSIYAHEHSAEADCLAIIRCVTQIADFFLEWSDNHAFPLVHCKKT